jgi:hypothetical protein
LKKTLAEKIEKFELAVETVAKELYIRHPLRSLSYIEAAPWENLSPRIQDFYRLDAESLLRTYEEVMNADPA